MASSDEPMIRWIPDPTVRHDIVLPYRKGMEAMVANVLKTPPVKSTPCKLFDEGEWKPWEFTLLTSRDWDFDKEIVSPIDRLCATC